MSAGLWKTASTNKSLAQMNKSEDWVRAYTIRQSGEGLSSTFPIRSANGPGWHAPHPPPAGASSFSS